MHFGQRPLSRRTVLRAAALSALTGAAALSAPPQPARAAGPNRPEPPRSKAGSHPSYEAIVGLL